MPPQVTNTVPQTQHESACSKLVTMDVSPTIAESIRRTQMLDYKHSIDLWKNARSVITNDFLQAVRRAEKKTYELFEIAPLCGPNGTSQLPLSLNEMN